MEMVARRVIETIAASQELPPDKIRPETTFEELGFDSLDAFNVLFALEEEFDVEIPDDAAREVRSVRDVVERIEELLAAPGGG